MKFGLPAIVFSILATIAFFLIPLYTRESGNSKALFQEEVLENNILKQQRHFDLIHKAKYLGLLESLNNMAEPFFAIETIASDSLMIKATKPTNRILKKRFERVFFNKKTMNKVKTFEHLPIKLVDEANVFGFVSEIVKKDSIAYLRLPFDALAGPFIEKEGIQ